MPDASVISELLRLKPEANAPEIVIYCHKVTPRLQAACRFIFETALQCNFRLEENDAPSQSSTPAIAYHSNYEGTLLHIWPAGLLEEKEIRNFIPPSTNKQGEHYLFPAASEFPFDLFSAVFYFISRYEEYQNYKRDEHGRFELQASYLYKKNWHLEPVLDQWCNQLAKSLEQKFPELKIPGRKFQKISSLDIDNLYAYRFKGIFRTAGAACRDLLRGDLKSFKTRIRVLSGKEKDPFDIYETVSEFCLNERVPLFCFFLMRSGRRYDRSVKPSSPAFKNVVETLAKNQAICGLHPSYDTIKNNYLLTEEIKYLQAAGVKDVFLSRQHFLRFDVRVSPGQLQAKGLQFDFTMGFATGAGFRAGTSLPFHWYNFSEEKNEDFIFIPFCAMDGAWSVYGNADTTTALKELQSLEESVKAQNGIFMTVFHERTFSDHLYKGFGSLYKKLYAGV